MQPVIKRLSIDVLKTRPSSAHGFKRLHCAVFFLILLSVIDPAMIIVEILFLVSTVNVFTQLELRRRRGILKIQFVETKLPNYARYSPG